MTLRRILLVEDHLSLIPGLRADLETEDEQMGDGIAVVDRVATTVEDGVAFFEGVARHGEEALRRIPVDAVMVDGFLPRDSVSAYAEFAAVEIAIRITSIYDRASVPEADRPHLILTTAAPDPCDVRAFVAYGGSDVVPKSSIPADALRKQLLEIIDGRRTWAPPEPRRLHRYTPSFARYLRGIELGLSTTTDVAARINAAPSAVTRVKNELRHVFDLPARASDREIVEAAKAAGITWIPLAYEALAQRYGVKPRLSPW
jgi:CheY-like chemotaxis protein